jgi:hypothetical protein
MITAEQIPDEVVEAFDRVFLEERKSGWTLDTTYRHALAAALNAWPGVWEYTYHDDGSLALILPLPKDAADE